MNSNVAFLILMFFSFTATILNTSPDEIILTPYAPAIAENKRVMIVGGILITGILFGVYLLVRKYDGNLEDKKIFLEENERDISHR